MKQLFRIAFLFLLIQFPVSCGLLNCGSDDEDPVVAEISEIAADFVFYNDLDGHNNYSSIATLLHTDAALRIFIEDLNYFQVAQTPSFSLISGAYACSPEPNIIYEQEIEEIVIIAQDAFVFDDERYRIGDTVNHIFRVLNFDTPSLMISLLNKIPIQHFSENWVRTLSCNWMAPLRIRSDLISIYPSSLKMKQFTGL